MYVARLLAASSPALHVLSPLISWLALWVLRIKVGQSYEEGETWAQQTMWSQAKKVIAAGEEIWPWVGSL